MVADATLIAGQRRLAAAASASFEDWYIAEHPKVLAAMTWVSADIDAARDATDEAFSRAFLHWRRVGSMASPGGWTYRVALNVLRRRMRRAALERDRMQPPAEVAPAVDTELWGVVAGLPQRQRVAVVLRYLLDLPEREVAQVMGIATGTVAATLAAARSKLAKWLQDEEEE